MLVIVNAKTATQVDILKICEIATSQFDSHLQQYRQTLATSHQWVRK